MTLNNNELSGTPSKPGPFTFTVTATDANGFTGERQYTVAIEAPTITITPASLAGGQVDNAYNPVPLTADGGVAPYSFQVTSGTLPAGLNVANSRISGTPSAPGSFAFTVTATDTNGSTGDRQYSITIKDLPPPDAKDHTLSVIAGTSGTVDLTQGATGGPFSAAAIATYPPSAAGKAQIVREKGKHVLHFAAANTYAGTTSLTYTLSNGGRVSAPATVTISVISRPDPSLDPEVIGLIRAQTESAKRFANTQIRNFSHRLEQLHNEGDRRSNAIGVNVAVVMDSNEQDAYERDLAQQDPTIALNGRNSSNVASAKAACIQMLKDTGSQQNATYEPAPATGSASVAPTSNGGQTCAQSTMLAFGSDGSPENAPRDLSLKAIETVSPVSEYGYAGSQAVPGENPLGEFAFWSGGYVNFGTNDHGAINLDNTLVGVSAGVDYRFTPKLTAGVGIGFGRDKTDINNNGTESDAEAFSFAAYGSYRPVPGFFIDGLAGYSTMNFDSQRYVTSTEKFAFGKRDGDQFFASLSAGYEYRRGGFLISPYGQLSGSRSTLDSFTEKGAGIYNLTFEEQEIDTLSGTFGLRLEHAIRTSWGILTPRARLEYTHDFEGSSRASLGYADIGTSPYMIDVDAFSRDNFTIGAGFDAQIGEDWNLGFDYRTALGTNGDSQEHTFATRLAVRF